MLVLLALTIFLSQSQALIFDNTYEVFNVSQNQNIYGYNINHLCRLKKVGNYYYATVESPYTFQKSSPSLIPSMSNTSQVLNCFQYRGYSYIFYKRNNYLGITRDQHERTFKILLNYTKFTYDHLYGKLYFLADEQNIYEFNLNILEKFWTIKNYPQWLIKNKRNASLEILFRKILEFPFKISKYLIYNETLFYKKVDEENIMKIRITGGEVWKIKENVQLDEIVLFLNFTCLEDFVTKKPKFLIETALISNPSFVFAIPSPPRDPSHVISYFLYILTLFLLLIFVFLCRKYGTPKLNNHINENEIYFDLVQK